MKLNDVWDFIYTESVPGMVDLPTEFPGKISLPGCWDDFSDAFAGFSVKTNEEYKAVDSEQLGSTPPDASLPFICGTVWYRKKINICQEQDYVVLHMGPAHMDAAIFLNGQLIDNHIGYSTSFEVELPAMPLGENELILAVSNTRRDRVGCLVRGFKGYSGGIFGDVELSLHKQSSIKDLFVYPDEKLQTLHWKTELYHPQDGLLLHAKILKDGALIDEIKSAEFNFQSDATALTPWSDENPELYQIELSVLSEGKILDVFKCDFGLRRLTTEKKNLRMNGVPIFLRGSTEHAYYAESCTPPTEKSYYLRIVSKVKELGFNWLRFHTSVPCEEYMQACDELGVLIQVEGPVGFGMQEWRDIVRACRCHPSVVIYCAGNEELLNEEKISYLECVASKTKMLAPDALFNPQEALRGVEYSWNFSDFGFPIKRKPFVHNPARLQHLQRFSDVLGQFSWGKLSYSSTSCDRGELDHKLAYYKLPCLSHEICIQGTYLDLSLEERYKKTRIGGRIYQPIRQNMTDAGVLDNAALYYKNSCRWQQALRKQSLENARSCSNLAGYDFLGAIDCHWHRYGYPCGILNEFYERKPGETMEDILAYNGRSVLLLEKGNKYCYRQNEKLNFGVLFSCFEPDGVTDAKLDVRLTTAAGKTVGSQSFMIDAVKCGCVAELAQGEFSFPVQKSAQQYFLEASFAGVKNRWPVWSFPDAVVEASGIIETEELDNALIDKISEGANCILYGKGPFPAIGTTWQLSVAGRAEGNLASVIRAHPIFANFPHEGWCDWHFADMFKNAEAVDLTNLDLPVIPIVEMVSSFKKIKRQAMLFELKIGRGSFVVCTLNLKNSPIAGSYLKAQLQHYLRSGKGGVKALVVEPAKFKKMIQHKYSSQSVLTTDEGFDALGQLKV